MPAFLKVNSFWKGWNGKAGSVALPLAKKKLSAHENWMKKMYPSIKLAGTFRVQSHEIFRLLINLKHVFINSRGKVDHSEKRWPKNHVAKLVFLLTCTSLCCWGYISIAHRNYFVHLQITCVILVKYKNDKECHTI